MRSVQHLAQQKIFPIEAGGCTKGRSATPQGKQAGEKDADGGVDTELGRYCTTGPKSRPKAVKQCPAGEL